MKVGCLSTGLLGKASVRAVWSCIKDRLKISPSSFTAGDSDCSVSAQQLTVPPAKGCCNLPIGCAQRHAPPYTWKAG